MAVRITSESCRITDSDGNKKAVIEGFCKSTDTKPTDGCLEGSILVESDTKKAFIFNESSKTWAEF